MQTSFRARFFLAAAISQLLLSIHHFHTSPLPLPPFGGLGNLGKEGPCWPLRGTPLVQTRPPGGEMKRLRWGDRAGGSLCQGRSPLLAHNQNRVGQHPSADLRLRFRRRPTPLESPRTWLSAPTLPAHIPSQELTPCSAALPRAPGSFPGPRPGGFSVGAACNSLCKVLGREVGPWDRRRVGVVVRVGAGGGRE